MTVVLSLGFRILELTKEFPDLSSEQIAQRLDSRASYVRTVWHRAGIFRGPHDSSVEYRSPPKYIRVPFKEYEALVAAAALGATTNREHGLRVIALPPHTNDPS